MNIQFVFDGGRIDAQLHTDSSAAEAFAELLPLTLTFEDYASTEKIAYLPRKLSSSGAEGYKPKQGDITYYAPWGNLAIFYRDFGFAPGLVNMGRIEGSADQLIQLEGREVTIRLAD